MAGGFVLACTIAWAPLALKGRELRRRDKRLERANWLPPHSETDRVALANRLARRAERRHTGGVRGLLARRAWDRLVRAGDAGDPAASEAVWHAWVRHPDDERGELLVRWGGSQAITDLIWAAVEPGQSNWAALGAFCASHDLAPDDPVRRAGFFALTGQPEQQRALDPDAALLATAYQAADPRTQAALREALAGAGDLDIVRVVARAGSQAADMTVTEREYLAGQLADRRDWAALWRLAQDLPPVDAVAAVHQIDERWRPAGQRERDLFGLLARAGPDKVRSAREALCADGATRIEVPGLMVAGALSANGRRLAVMHRDFSLVPAATKISVFELPLGRPTMQYSTTIESVGLLAYAGKMLIAVDSSPAASLLYRCPDGQPMELAFRDPYRIQAIATRSRGFAAVGYAGGLGFHHDNGTRFRIHCLRWGHQTIITADRDSGRLAVAHGQEVTLLEARHARRVRAARQTLTQISQVTGICFHGPDRVITTNPWEISQWRVDAVQHPPFSLQVERRLRHACSPLLIAARNEVCILDDHGEVAYFDADTLEPTDRRRELTGRTGELLWSSPGNICHALGGHGFVDVVTREQMAMQALADRPQSAWVPADLATALKAAPIAARCPAARPLQDVLLGCLEYRFGDEVRLGRRTVAMGDDDIGISSIPREG
jgi:hypothetical protein